MGLCELFEIWNVIVYEIFRSENFFLLIVSSYKKRNTNKRNNYLITHNQQVNPINEIIFTYKCQVN